MYAFANFRTPIVALATILAMLLVPACGSVCTAMTHCSTGAVAANSDSCHHTEMSAQSDSGAQATSSDASCGQQTPLLATLTSSDSSFQVVSVASANAAVSVETLVQAVTLSGHAHDFLPPKRSPQQSIPLENLSVLRI